jgi:LysM repeat protein
MLKLFVSSTRLPWWMLGLIGIGVLEGCTVVSPVGNRPVTSDSTRTIMQASPSSVYYQTSPSYRSQCHQVNSGENLYRIGLSYGISYQQIARWNGLSVSRMDDNNPVYDLKPGQQLKLSESAVCR